MTPSCESKALEWDELGDTTNVGLRVRVQGFGFRGLAFKSA